MSEDSERIEITLEHLVAMLSVSKGDNVSDTRTSTLLMEVNFNHPEYVKLTRPKNLRKYQRVNPICWAKVTDVGKKFLLEKIKGELE